MRWLALIGLVGCSGTQVTVDSDCTASDIDHLEVTVTAGGTSGPSFSVPTQGNPPPWTFGLSFPSDRSGPFNVEVQAVTKNSVVRAMSMGRGVIGIAVTVALSGCGGVNVADMSPQQDQTAGTVDMVSADATPAVPPDLSAPIADMTVTVLPDLWAPDFWAPDFWAADGTVPTCTDGQKNGNETDVDCGGSCPKVCANGQMCKMPTDCSSSVCSTTCQAATCSDTVKNGTETDIDCGGSCNPCVAAKACKVNADCTTGVCASSLCALPAPAVTSVSPMRVGSKGADVVTITGSGFVNGATIKIDGLMATNVVVVSSTSITATSPKDGPPTGKQWPYVVDVKVTNPDGQSVTLSGKLAYYPSTLSFGSPINVGSTALDYGAVIAPDLNGDGKADLVAISGTGVNMPKNTLSPFIGNGNGIFQSLPSQVLTGVDNQYGPIYSGDLDKDGHPDIVFSASTPATFYAFGVGDGNLASPQSIPMKSASGAAIADFNGDGYLDIAGGDNASYTINCALNNKKAGFLAPIATTLSWSPTQLVAADFNGDMIPDLAFHANTTSSNSTGVAFGAGNGMFAFQSTYGGTGGIPNIGDFNEDGYPDILLGGAIADNIVYMPGTKSGAFPKSINESTPGSTNNTVAVDMNLDGHMDVVVSLVDTHGYVVLGKGDGTFQPATSIELGWVLYYVAAGDFNADGLPDLVFSLPGGGVHQMVVLLNTSQ